MPKMKSEPITPNAEIDAALSGLMDKIKDMEPDMAVKVINSAISWEKVKNKILEKDEEFSVDNL